MKKHMKRHVIVGGPPSFLNFTSKEDYENYVLELLKEEILNKTSFKTSNEEFCPEGDAYMVVFDLKINVKLVHVRGQDIPIDEIFENPKFSVSETTCDLALNEPYYDYLNKIPPQLHYLLGVDSHLFIQCRETPDDYNKREPGSIKGIFDALAFILEKCDDTNNKLTLDDIKHI